MTRRRSFSETPSQPGGPTSARPVGQLLNPLYHPICQAEAAIRLCA